MPRPPVAAGSDLQRYGFVSGFSGFHRSAAPPKRNARQSGGAGTFGILVIILALLVSWAAGIDLGADWDAPRERATSEAP